MPPLLMTLESAGETVRVISCILVEHNLWLVALSLAMCIVACSVTLLLWRRALVDEASRWSEAEHV